MQKLTMNVSQWQHFLYEESRSEIHELRVLEQRGAKVYSKYAAWQFELFARLYNPQTPTMKEIDPAYSWASQLHEIMSDMPEFAMLQQQTSGDADFAAKAALVLSRSMIATIHSKKNHVPRGDVEAELEELDRYLKSLEEMKLSGINVDHQVQRTKQKQKYLEGVLDRVSKDIDPSKVKGAVRKAVDKAVDDHKKYQQMMSAFSFGNHDLDLRSSGNEKAKRVVAKYLENNTYIQKIATLAGRLKKIAAKKQREKSHDAKHEVADIEQGADLSKLLPTEMLALCGDEVSQLLFFKRWTERQILQYQLKGKEPKGRGALVVCIDESGSMSGDRDVYAKATMLSLLHIAIAQKRTFVMIHFSGSIKHVSVIKKGAVDHDTLMQNLNYFSGGGTNFNLPIMRACKMIADDAEDRDISKADIVFITDGEATVHDVTQKQVQHLNDEIGLNFYTILVGGVRAVSGLKEISNEILHLKDIVSDRDTNAKEALFSI